MKLTRLLPLPFAATALISGCATTPGACDPSREDFLNNTSCLASGAYQQRQRDLESTLSAEQGRNRAFRILLADLELEKTATRSDLRAQQAAYARAEASWRQIKSSLASESKNNPALATRVRQIDEDLSGLEAGKRAERDALANRVRLLQQELDAGIYDDI